MQEQGMIGYVKSGELVLAIVLYAGYTHEGVVFLTPDIYSQQLGYMHHPAGYVIQPHVHNPVPREVQYTKEVLFIRSGKVRADFYDNDRNYLESIILNQGDVLLLAYGGHGFEMLEESEMVEVKQGPYAGGADKTRFCPVSPGALHIGSRGGDEAGPTDRYDEG